MSDTLQSIRTEILGWLQGDFAAATTAGTTQQVTVNAAINDAIESGWNDMMVVQLARFFGTDSPVTFSLAAGAERVQLVSIVDPTVAPVTGTQVGGALAGRAYNVSYAFVTESGAETNPSPATVQVVGANNLLTTTPPVSPGNAFGWNLYVGVLSPALQNQQPLPFTGTVLEPTTGYQDYPTFEQTPPTSNRTADNISYITHMEIRTSDTLLRSWNQSDIDSMLFRQFGRTLSSASEFQAYAWDLINGRVLEFRPTTGLAFTPRYFYIAKPRRLRYDQAEIPYTEITGWHEYVTAKTIAKLKLSLEEYLAQQAWTGVAAGEMMKIRLSLTEEISHKNKQIAPHLY